MNTKEVLYHGYTVTALIIESATGSWQSACRVSWSRGRQELTLHDLASFTNQNAAVNHALKLGKQWVDNRLNGQMFILK